ncbi:MAG: EAL domain-containing protein [Gemmatimonadota bacterium]
MQGPGASRQSASFNAKEAQDDVLRDSLPVGALGLSLLYLAFGVGHLKLLPENAASLMATVAFATSILFLAVGIAGRRRRLPLSGNAVGIVLMAAMILNCAAHMYLTADPQASVNFAILAVALGLFGVSLQWLLIGLALLVGAWWATALAIPGFPIMRYGLMIGGAISAALVSTWLRRRLYGRLTQLREESDARSRELLTSEQRMRLAMAGSNDGLYDWDLDTGEVLWSDRVRALLADGDGEFGGRVGELVRRIHPEDVERVREQFRVFLHSEGLQFEDEFRVRYADGTFRWLLVRGACTRTPQGRVERLAGSLTDMSRRGVFDALTGLPNRRLLLDRLARLASRPRLPESDESFVVLFLDLDDFKVVNDSLGHKTGDDLLCEVAKRLQSCVRGSDMVARLGGDEFVVLLEKVQVPEGVQITIDRIVAKLGQPFFLDGRELYIRPSIGVVMDTHAYTNPDEILRDADTAMYRAKDSHPEFAIFDATMRERLTERLRLETELRGALAREEFVVHYQTIVSLASGEVEGLEALVRWQHPRRGLLLPGEFIGVMEDTGLVIPLGAVVLRQACRQMVEWFAHMRPDDMPYLSVNLSGKHLAQDNPAAVVEEVLAETGFPPHRLRIEITESAIIESPRRAAAALGQLKLLGVRVLMDDFGTGQSSLAYLQKLPIDTLKIDRSFISTMTAQREGEELVRTIVRMADSLGLGVVAEGIETDEQARMLRAMRCGSGQGYLFARPAELGLVAGPRQEPAATAPVPAPASGAVGS